MKLKKVIIENFRCYKDITEVDIDDITVFVGANDSGKSSILEALDIFFNEGKGEVKLTDDDINIYVREEKPDIKITCIFKDIPEELIKELEKNGITITDSSLSITKTFGTSNKTYLNDNEIPKKSRLSVEIKRHLPVYGLFKVERTNTDDNPEVKDPLMFTVEQVLKEQEVKEKLQEIANRVKNAVEQVAKGTLDKLMQLNNKVANELRPNIPDIEELKWLDVFKKIGIHSDKGIPLNKRGSGVRRLVLLSFFLFEAERKREVRKTSEVNIIYAIEEPETSLHPDHQRQFMNSLLELSQNEKVQVLITTHSPYIAQMAPIDNLRFIDRERYPEDRTPKVISGKENKRILLDIANRLGIHPITTKVVIYVEGRTDKQFLLNINKNIKELNDIIDLNKEIDMKTITIIPLIGSNLKEWINEHYLKDSGLLEFHLYDNDREDYREEIRKVNSRNDGSVALTTRMREIENYIHWELIEEEFNIEIPYDIKHKWKDFDIPKWLSNKLGIKEKDIKTKLCGKLAKRLTKKHLEELGVWDEVKGWFEKISELVRKATPQRGMNIVN